MKILTFDTALDKTYISLFDGGLGIEKLTIETKEDKYHSAFLIEELANILKRNNLKMQDIEAIGINVGPGSFTGIRACTTVGRVIAQQINAPLVPVSSLEILSYINKENKTLVTLDARKNSAYVGVYENGIVLIPPKIVSVEDMVKLAKEKNQTIICDSTMAEKLGEAAISVINYENNDYPLNEFLGKITCKKLAESEDVKTDYNWAKVKPLYIQPPSIFGK